MALEHISPVCSCNFNKTTGAFKKDDSNQASGNTAAAKSLSGETSSQMSKKKKMNAFIRANDSLDRSIIRTICCFLSGDK